MTYLELCRAVAGLAFGPMLLIVALQGVLRPREGDSMALMGVLAVAGVLSISAGLWWLGVGR